MKTAAILFLVILPFKCLAQNQEDLKMFKNLFAEKSHNHKWGDQLKDNKNEITFIFSATFVLYKEIFSSQDIDACVFTPSCSVYAIESIKRKGVIPGFLNAIDRLTRCNPGHKKDMPIDLSTGKYYDPVESTPSGQNTNKMQ
ncbi:MAG: membrane protein insertion efficiency factor YidD [Bacteroidales bacterium]|jgi:putative component of membrane protein insertase Oxa1/YidC/SpoIIIJ protein YidD